MIKSVPGASWLVFLIGVTLWVATASTLRREYPGDWGDDAQYLVSARSLCDQHGYRLISRPGDPVATKYPIGLPAITALVMAILPGQASTEHDWLAGRIVVIGSGVLFVVFCRRFFEFSGFSVWSACLLGLAMTWFPWMFYLTATLMSDVPYAAVCVILVTRWIRRNGSEPVPARDCFIDGVLAGAGWLIRANGITLVVAALVAAIQTRSRWRQLAAVLIGIACLKGPAALYLANLTGPRDTNTYLTEQIAAYQAASHYWSLPLSNLSRIPRLLFSTICPPSEWTNRVISIFSSWVALRWIGTLGVCGLLICGVARLIRRKIWPPAVWVYVGATLAVNVVWYFPIDHRFVLSLIPFIFAICSIGTEVVVKVKRQIVVPIFCGGMISGSLLVVLGMIWRSFFQGGVAPDQNSTKFHALFKATATETPRDAVILCHCPEFVYLNAGRKAAPLKDDVLLVASRPLSWARLQYWIGLAESRPLYAITDERDGIREKELYEQIDEKYRLTRIHSLPDSCLWRVDRIEKTP